MSGDVGEGEAVLSALVLPSPAGLEAKGGKKKEEEGRFGSEAEEGGGEPGGSAAFGGTGPRGGPWG